MSRPNSLTQELDAAPLTAKTVPKLSRLIGLSDASTIIDLRIDDDNDADPRLAFSSSVTLRQVACEFSRLGHSEVNVSDERMKDFAQRQELAVTAHICSQLHAQWQSLSRLRNAYHKCRTTSEVEGSSEG